MPIETYDKETTHFERSRGLREVTLNLKLLTTEIKKAFDEATDYLEDLPLNYQETVHYREATSAIRDCSTYIISLKDDITIFEQIKKDTNDFDDEIITDLFDSLDGFSFLVYRVINFIKSKLKLANDKLLKIIRHCATIRDNLNS